MAELQSLIKNTRGVHRCVTPATPGIFVTKVGLGRRMQMNISNPGGSTFDIVGYLVGEDVAAKFGFTRLLATYETGISSLTFNTSSITTMQWLGVNITSFVDVITFEILESKL